MRQLAFFQKLHNVYVTRKLRRMDTKNYWSNQRLRQRARFEFTSLQYRLFKRKENLSTVRSHFFSVIATIVLPFILSVLAVGMLCLIEHTLSTYWRVPLFVKTRNFQGLFSTLAQTVGAFVGLFYASLSVIISTSYSSTSSEIRRLVVKNSLSNIYLKISTFLVGASVVQLILTSTSYSPGLLNASTDLVLCAITIFFFGSIALGLFRLFDISLLIQASLGEFATHVRGAASNKSWSKDNSFQLHHAKLAANCLANVEELIKLQQNRKATSTYLKHHGLSITAAFQPYLEVKNQIPLHSLWYFRKRKIPPWSLTTEAQATMALMGGTVYSGEEVEDTLWVEKRLLSMVKSIALVLIEARDFASLLQVFNALQEETQNCAALGGIEESALIFKLHAELTGSVIEHLETFSELDAISRIGLGDLLGAGAISRLIGMMQTFQKFPLSNNLIDLEGIESNTTDRKLTRIDKLNRSLEHLGKWIAFEKDVEGKRITSNWYINADVAFVYVRYFNEFLSSLRGSLQELLATAKKAREREANPLFVLAICIRIHEFRRRLNPYLINLRSIIKKGTDSIPEQNLDLVPELISEEPLDDYRQAVLIVVEVLIENPHYSRTDEIPDYFGRCVSWVADEISDAMENGDVDYFKELFPKYLSACWSDYIRGLNEPILDKRLRFRQVTQPLKDLMVLCGYAKLYDELTQEQFWPITIVAWNEFLESHPNADKVCEFLAGVGDNRRIDFFFSVNDQINHRWRMQLTEHVRQTRPAFNPFDSMHSTKKRSLIDKYFYDGRMMSGDPEDIFLAFYLKDHHSARNVTFSRKVEDLRKRFSNDSTER